MLPGMNDRHNIQFFLQVRLAVRSRQESTMQRMVAAHVNQWSWLDAKAVVGQVAAVRVKPNAARYASSAMMAHGTPKMLT
jgi:hypothetical protein